MKYTRPNNIKKYLTQKFIEKEGFPKNIHSIKPLLNSCNSFAFEINNDYIVKFTLNEKSFFKLKKEEQVLNFLQNKISLDIPKPKLFKGEYPFTIHRKIPGENLSQERYTKLSIIEKEILAHDLSLFLSELHSIKLKEVEKFNLPYWDRYDRVFPSKKIILETLEKTNELDPKYKKFLKEFCENYHKDKEERELVFGHFDIMSKNFVYSFEDKKLKGIFDFGDCGIGNHLHDFSQMNFGKDLWERMEKYYSKLSKNSFDLRRIQDHSLFASLGFYINLINGIEKVQTNCLDRLIFEIRDYGVN